MAKKNSPAKKAAPKKAAPAKKATAKKAAPKKAAPKKVANIAGTDAMEAIMWMPVCLGSHGNLATACMDRHSAFQIAAAHHLATGDSVNIRSC